MDHLTLKNDCYSIEYNNLDGGTIKEISYQGHALISDLVDAYPDKENNYRLSLAHPIDDGESIISSTYHRRPKLTMNRSYVILDDCQGVKLKWVMKNTGVEPFAGKRSIRLQIKGEKITYENQGQTLIVKLTNPEGDDLVLTLSNSEPSSANSFFKTYIKQLPGSLQVEFRELNGFKRGPKQGLSWWLTLRVEEP